MTVVRRAVIDVGTNSVKLLVADVAGRTVQPVFETGNQTRLGRGFYETHRLQPAAIASTAAAVAEFARVARAHQVTSVRVFGTSAVRDAANASELITAVQRAAELPLEVISGEQEAAWAFRGAASDLQLAGTPILLLDVGGGSTEFILGCGKQNHFQCSFPLGAVRLMERVPHSEPPTPDELGNCRNWLRQFLFEAVRPLLAPAVVQEVNRHQQHRAVQLVGSGGAATVLARMELQLTGYDRDRIAAARLSRARVGEWVERLWSLPRGQREKIIGLPPERADVALTGAAIYEAVMAEFDFAELRVTTRGLRFAAVLEDA